MYLKTSYARASFPWADEENDHGQSADDRRGQGDPI